MANIFLQHTSASLSINENADPTVRTDMENALNKIVPEDWHEGPDAFFEHTLEGPDDMTGRWVGWLGCLLKALLRVLQRVQL